MLLLDTWWTFICDLLGDDFFYVDFAVSIVTTVVSFWTLAGLFLVADVTGRPRWMIKYKVQPGKNQPVDGDKLRNAIKYVRMNQTLIGLPLLVLMCLARAQLGCPHKPSQLPNIFTFVRDIAVCDLLREIGFYYTHRLLHWGPLYKFHKRHHEWTAPIGLISVYAHPVEYIVSNILPVFVGPLLLRSHTLTSAAWLATATFITIVHHSGYHLPGLLSPQFHDFHHLKVNYNYGVLGWLDWLHGTDSLYRDSIEFQRDRISFSLTPVNELYVDTDKRSN